MENVMGYAKNALKAGGVAAGSVFVVCCFIPIVGPLVGVVAGGVTFLVVEAGALTAYGVYAAGKGVAHGVYHIQESNEHRREQRRERRERRRAVAEFSASQPTDTPALTSNAIISQLMAIPSIDPGMAAQPVVDINHHVDEDKNKAPKQRHKQGHHRSHHEASGHDSDKHLHISHGHNRHRHRHHHSEKEKSVEVAANEPVPSLAL